MPDTNGHGNGAFPHGTPLDEPIDLVAVQADDELINALSAGMALSSTGSRAFHADEQVVSLLSAWRADVTADPVPDLIDLETAIAAVKAGAAAAQESARPTRSARARHLVPVAAAAAFLVLVGGGVSIGSATAQPDSTLWPVSKMLFSERAASVEAAVRASDKIDNAKHAIADGQPDAAAKELAQAQDDLKAVRPQEGQAQLVDVKDFLVAKAAETPSGTSVDPATPLKTDKARPIPAGAALSQEPAAAGTLSPAPSTEEKPTTASPRPSRSPRPTPRPGGGGGGGHSATTPAAPDPEVTTGSAGVSAGATAGASTTATPEGEPDTTANSTSTTGLGTNESTTPTTSTS